MHIHILGICGAFMGGIAQIAHSLGHKVTGSDQNVYPPMSDQLEKSGITLMQGYLPEHLQPSPDQVIVGNVLARGNPALEYVLNEQLPYFSGPEWLYREFLQDKHVLAVSGTHGKTTTATILVWMLEYAGYKPGFLIGGVAENFGITARNTDSNYFVIEADEYDTAFFDKRSKFIHYHPKTLIINNIEFDHADIFHDIGAIKREFHHLVRILPEQARIIYPKNDLHIEDVLAMGCWSERVDFAGQGSDWVIESANSDFSQFSLTSCGKKVGAVQWGIIGEHNACNVLAAVIAAEHIGIEPARACGALSEFKSVKRRLECIYDRNGIRLYDDFAHHPTAIEKTLEALRQHVGDARIVAIMEPRSNTMKMGIHAKTLAASLNEADRVLLYQAETIDWDLAGNMRELGDRCHILISIDAIINEIAEDHKSGDHIIIMSNGGFAGIHKRLIKLLS